MSNVTTKDDLAKIAIAKNLIKEYKTSNAERTVYLNDGTEFQIYLKNPYQTHTGIRISVNDKPIGNMLVLKPGQSFWLDRFLNENKKFLFSTYEVENSKEMEYATAKNGKVKIEFFHEKENSTPLISTGYVYPNNVYFNATPINNGYSSTYGAVTNNVNTVLTASSAIRDLNDQTLGFSIDSLDDVKIGTVDGAKVDRSATKRLMKQGTMETGRVEKGGASDQTFDVCDIEFDYWPFKTEVIQILPNSRKQIRPEDTRRKYCSQCGKKVSPKDKFCSNCGARLD